MRALRNRIALVSLAVLVLVAAALAWRWASSLRESYPLSFVLLSDNHNELRTLSQTVDRINRLDVKPNFVVSLGDNIDNVEPDSYSRAGDAEPTKTISLAWYFDYARILDDLKMPRYLIIGNHDYHNIARLAVDPAYVPPAFDGRNRPMEILYEAWDMPYRWFCVDRDGYRLLFLDWNGWGCNINEFADARGVFWDRPALERFLSAQEKWIRERVAETERKVIVFTHFANYGPGNGRGLDLLFPGMWENMFDSLKGRVVAVFFGHRHRQEIVERNGILYGMINTNSIAGSAAQVVVDKRGRFSVRQAGPSYLETMAYGPDSLAPLGEEFDIAPYVRETKPDRVEIVCRTRSEKMLLARVESGLFGTKRRESKAARDHVFEFDGLSRGREFRYQIGVSLPDGTHWLKPVQKFKTLPGLDARAFRFAAYGDSRTSSETHQSVLNAIEATHPDFVVSTGDLCDKPDSLAAWKKQFLLPAGSLMSHTPLFAAIGNHDRPDALFRRLLVSGTSGPNWYDFQAGPCHFFIMDFTSSMTTDSDQYKWLSASLEASKAKWKIVVTHGVPYTSGPHGKIAPSGLLQEEALQRFHDLIEPLLVAQGVRIVLAGHDHDYEHSFRDGVHYFVLGGGGAPLYAMRGGEAVQNPFSIRFKSVHHFALFEVTPEIIRVTAKDINGAPIDSVDIRPKAPWGK